jgi:hypothetical protein
MLIESIPKEPLSFHVIPFDNPRLQYTMQAKDLDHKRKWCHEIKRLILENYSAVIPEKAKALVMMLGNEKGLYKKILSILLPSSRMFVTQSYSDHQGSCCPSVLDNYINVARNGGRKIKKIDKVKKILIIEKK